MDTKYYQISGYLPLKPSRLFKNNPSNSLPEAPYGIFKFNFNLWTLRVTAVLFQFIWRNVRIKLCEWSWSKRSLSKYIIV